MTESTEPGLVDRSMLARLQTSSGRTDLAWTLLRLVVAGIIAAHGWARLMAGAVVPFGTWLTGLGFPLGSEIAWAITVLEIVGSLLLVFRKYVLPLALMYAFVYAIGIVLVHSKAGWFVVGLGRNGSEFSVLLIACLLCLALQHSRTPGSLGKGT